MTADAARAIVVMRSVDGARLMLEPLCAEHAEAMFVVLSDPAIYEYENAPPLSVGWLRARYAMLESRRSPDARQQWLNWVIRLPDSALIGYVQATVTADGSALIAYELGSAYWGRGWAYQAVSAMIGELAAQYQVRACWALLKRRNHRSMRLLERLDFVPATGEQHVAHAAALDEALMHRDVSLT